jgi:hypothetical protein
MKAFKFPTGIFIIDPSLACTLYTYYVANGFTPFFSPPIYALAVIIIPLWRAHMTLFAKHAKCDVSKIPISVS